MSYNYGLWLRRLSTFVGGLEHLPGRPELKCEIGPPVDKGAALSNRYFVGRQLPIALFRFYTEGSAKCVCTYWWDVPEPMLTTLHDVFPIENVLIGGLNLCGIDKMEYYLQGCLDTADGLESNKRYEDAKMWSNAFPFHNLGTGDYLGIYTGSDWQSSGCPVVLLDHDGCRSRIISPDFDLFLDTWEKLNYLNPLTASGNFTNYATGFMRSESRLATALAGFWKQALQ